VRWYPGCDLPHPSYAEIPKNQKKDDLRVVHVWNMHNIYVGGYGEQTSGRCDGKYHFDEEAGGTVHLVADAARERGIPAARWCALSHLCWCMLLFET
jgi:hypothetical protein